ncbi:ABC transporter permease [Aminobacter sp. MSH1]|uniref:ABC transporter permease n=1 Tax=Aminobacter sp. MSH1 TaxID=374606 RepID=UPI001FE135DE|nr:ABC transporter permease [Aminobacter sp. MSH1]
MSFSKEAAMRTEAGTSSPDDGSLLHEAGVRRRLAVFIRRSPLFGVGMLLCLSILMIAAFAPLIAPYPEDAGTTVRFASRLQPPSAQFWFGTDEVGRDVLSRVLMGTQATIMMALTVLFISVLIGVPLGVIAGFWKIGMLSGTIMRVTEVFLAIPSLVFVLSVSALLGPSLPVTILAISLAWWTWYARLAYGETLLLQQQQFVDAARVAGASSLRIAFSEILPNLTSVLLVKITVDLGYVVLLGASLGFLGLGVQAPTPEWGVMIANGRELLPDAWWLVTFPGLAIVITVVAFNLLGDGISDFLSSAYD